MDTTPQPDAPPAPAGPDPQQLQRIADGEEFHGLRRAFRGFAFPLTVGFIAWYLLYVLLSNYAGGFMGTTVVGHINVALVMGLLQFATTFAIAWLYSRHAARRLDPPAAAIRERFSASQEGVE
ncbi:DUF485 domain-containing protein [Peterkaempfera bronchialis]|uniref:DUF485 domain-containing protein n=1 Tax=Peterkaempfera bronchialis TaxID=2126346 RepID=A0A345T232_9ACTN|nr:DUF485 domain-containing protein [Peterkaempfera bronchialis]AXI80037.1 DUF485 domain-containing protein [Peterkaempfera bronchialis]